MQSSLNEERTGINMLPTDVKRAVPTSGISTRLGLLRRLKDAATYNKTSVVNEIYKGEPTFFFNPKIAAPCVFPGESAAVLESWPNVVKIFEDKYSEVYIQSITKKKAHLDCIDGVNKLIHEPKYKWCHILLLDALVHSANDYSFSNLVESSVRRRMFNQHLELRNSIIEEYNRLFIPNGSVSQSADGIVTPDIFVSDLPMAMPTKHLPPQSSVTTDQTSPPLVNTPCVDMEISYELAMTSSPLPSASSDAAGKAKIDKKRKQSLNSPELDDEVVNDDILDDMSFLLSGGDPESSLESKKLKGSKGVDLKRHISWESLAVLQEYLLSLSGNEKSSTRFHSIVNNLCSKLNTGNGNSSAEDPRSPGSPVCPMSPTGLRGIIALVVAKALAPPSPHMDDPLHPLSYHGQTPWSAITNTRTSVLTVNPSVTRDSLEIEDAEDTGLYAMMTMETEDTYHCDYSNTDQYENQYEGLNKLGSTLSSYEDHSYAMKSEYTRCDSHANDMVHGVKVEREIDIEYNTCETADVKMEMVEDEYDNYNHYDNYDNDGIDRGDQGGSQETMLSQSWVIPMEDTDVSQNENNSRESEGSLQSIFDYNVLCSPAVGTL